MELNETFQYTKHRVPYLRRGAFATVELGGGCQLHVPTRSDDTAMLELELLVDALDKGAFHDEGDAVAATRGS
jgi:hypothetical protein